MTLQKTILKNCKQIIDKGSLNALKQYYNEIQQYDLDYDINISYIYSQVYNYSCIKGNKNVILWLIQLYLGFDEMTQIALRQMFVYGKYLLIKKENKNKS